MGFIGWIIMGLVVGAIASAILRDRAPGGFLATLLLGIVGAVVGGWIGSALWGEGIEGFFDLSSWLLAILGAVIVLLIYGALTGRRRT